MLNRIDAQRRIAAWARRCREHEGRALAEGFLLLIVVGMCALHALGAQSSLDFFAMNGVFQNYNPVRRLLSGQIPYKDFVDYLGLGHLYLGSLATMVFGGGYAASLSGFVFLSALSLALYAVVLGSSITGSRRTGLFSAMVVIVCVSTSALQLDDTSILGKFVTSLQNAFSTGNSARFVRGMAPTLFVIELWAISHLIGHSHRYARLTTSRKRLVSLITYSFVAGGTISFSNDYGISCYLCATLLLIIIELKRCKKFSEFAFMGIVYVLTSLLSLYIAVMILTLGNFPEWLHRTFGTGGYQAWYYGVPGIAGKSYFYYDVDADFLIILQGIISISYFVQMVKHTLGKKTLSRYGVPGLLNIVSFCAANEYKLLSGGVLHEVSYATLGLTLIFEVMTYAGSRLTASEEGRQKTAAIVPESVIRILTVSWLISSMFLLVPHLPKMLSDKPWWQRTSRAADIENALTFTNEGKVFSTYASAYEAASGLFQPSGYDYIIHVLGDDARTKYLESFRQGNFDYVVTMRESYSEWEWWVRCANWFFYRELYAGYHPVFQNRYQLFFSRNDSANDGVVPGEEAEVELIHDDCDTWRIIVRTDESVNGFADMDITWAATRRKDSRRALLAFTSMVAVENTGEKESQYESFYLPANGSTQIPIRIVNGYGEATLTAKPSSCMNLELSSASCERVFTAIWLDNGQVNEGAS